jgi:hypothetical protein
VDGQLDLALQTWDWESPNPGRAPVEIGNMISWDDNLRMWRINGKAPRIVACPLCDREMIPCHDDGRWVCLNIGPHQEALDWGDGVP